MAITAFERIVSIRNLGKKTYTASIRTAAITKAFNSTASSLATQVASFLCPFCIRTTCSGTIAVTGINGIHSIG